MQKPVSAQRSRSGIWGIRPRRKCTEMQKPVSTQRSEEFFQIVAWIHVFTLSAPAHGPPCPKAPRWDCANIIKKHCLEQGWREIDHTQKCSDGTSTKAFRWDCANIIKKHCLEQGLREMDQAQKCSDGTSIKTRKCKTIQNAKTSICATIQE